MDTPSYLELCCWWLFNGNIILGPFSQHNCIENLRNLLVENQQLDFQITLQECSLSEPLGWTSQIYSVLMCTICLFYSGFMKVSTILQSYWDSVKIWRGVQCSLLECCLTEISHPRYGKCPKISNILKFWTPNIFAHNNFWKCPKISNSSSFAKRGFLKFRTQLSSSNFLSVHSNFGNIFFFFFFLHYRTKN